MAAKTSWSSAEIAKMHTWATDDEGLRVPGLFIELEFVGTDTSTGKPSNKYYTIGLTGTVSMFWSGRISGDRYANKGLFTPAVHDSIADAIARCQKKFSSETAVSKSTPYKVVKIFRAYLAPQFLEKLLNCDVRGSELRPEDANPLFEYIELIEARDIFDTSNPAFTGKNAFSRGVKEYLEVEIDAIDIYSISEIVHNRDSVERMVGVANVNARDNVISVPDDQLFRLNGQRYWPRLVGDVQDIALFRHYRSQGVHFVLLSDPGTGKTAALEVAFKGHLYVIQGTESTRPEDFLGQWVPDEDGNYEFVYGPAIKAALEGAVLYVDEIGRIPDNTLAAVNAFTDERMFIPDPNPKADRDPVTGEIPMLEIMDGFIMVAAYNPKIRGSSIPADLRSRFEPINWSTDYDLAHKFDCPHAFVQLAEAMDALRIDNILDWAPEMRELKRVGRLVNTLGMAHCLAALINQIPTPANREYVIDNLLASYFEDAMLAHIDLKSKRGLSAGAAIQ